MACSDATGFPEESLSCLHPSPLRAGVVPNRWVHYQWPLSCIQKCSKARHCAQDCHPYAAVPRTSPLPAYFQETLLPGLALGWPWLLTVTGSWLGAASPGRSDKCPHSFMGSHCPQELGCAPSPWWPPSQLNMFRMIFQQSSWNGRGSPGSPLSTQLANHNYWTTLGFAENHGCFKSIRKKFLKTCILWLLPLTDLFHSGQYPPVPSTSR